MPRKVWLGIWIPPKQEVETGNNFIFRNPRLWSDNPLLQTYFKRESYIHVTARPRL